MPFSISWPAPMFGSRWTPLYAPLTFTVLLLFYLHSFRSLNTSGPINDSFLTLATFIFLAWTYSLWTLWKYLKTPCQTKLLLFPDALILDSPKRMPPEIHGKSEISIHTEDGRLRLTGTRLDGKPAPIELRGKLTLPDKAWLGELLCRWESGRLWTS